MLKTSYVILAFVIALLIAFIAANCALENYRTREVKTIQRFISNSDILGSIDPPDLKILDVGAGDGHVSRALHNYDMTMIDVESKNSDVIIYDGENIPFEDNSFDLVICVYVLHHISDDKRDDFLRELSRVAKHVIVFEDLPDTSLTKLGTMFYEKHFKLFGTKPMLPYDKDSLVDHLEQYYTILDRKILSPTLIIQYKRIGVMLEKYQ